MSERAIVPARTYDGLRQIELSLFHDCKRLEALAEQAQFDDRELFANLLALVERNRFAIAVVGEFKRGKSTFINALLGAEVLPSAIEACSATLNRVTYGLEKRASIVMRGEGPPIERTVEIPIERLTDYVTKLTPQAAEMSDRVEEAVVAYPTRFCRNNVDIIDTPGLNDDAVMTRITMGALARANAALMVIRADLPFSQSEGRFLATIIEEEIRNVIIVVTAIDAIDPEDRPRQLQAIKQRVARSLRQHARDMFPDGDSAGERFLARIGDPPIIGVSGLLALEARSQHDAELEIESGFPQFEAALEELLAAREGASTILQIGQRLAGAATLLTAQMSARRRVQRDRLTEFNLGAGELAEAFARADEWEGHMRDRAEVRALALMRRASAFADTLLPTLDETLARALEDQSLTLSDIAASAYDFTRRQGVPFPIAPQVRDRLARFLATTSLTMPSPVAAIAPRLAEALTNGWGDLIDRLIEWCDRELITFGEEILDHCEQDADLDRPVWEQFAERWSAIPREVTTSEPTFAPILANSRARRATWESTARRQTDGTIVVMPSIVALRVMTHLAAGQLPQTPDQRPAIAAFRESVLQATTSGLRHHWPRWRIVLGAVIGHTLEQPCHEFRAATDDYIAARQQERRVLRTEVDRLRGALAGRADAEEEALAQQEVEVATILQGARQLCAAMEA